MDKCPRCGSTRVYVSRHRGASERLHQMFTAKRPYRCHTCGWREWTECDVHSPTRPDVDVQILREAPPERPLTAGDLDRLDPADREDAKRRLRRGPLSGDEIDAVDPDGASD